METVQNTSTTGQRAAQVGILTLTPAMVAGVLLWAPKMVAAIRRGDPAAMIVTLVAVFAALVLIWHMLSLLAAYIAILESAPVFLRHLLRGLIQHVGTGQARTLLYRHTAATAMTTTLLTGVVPGALALEPCLEPGLEPAVTTVGTEVTTTWDLPNDLAWGGQPASPATESNQAQAGIDLSQFWQTQVPLPALDSPTSGIMPSLRAAPETSATSSSAPSVPDSPTLATVAAPTTPVASPTPPRPPTPQPPSEQTPLNTRVHPAPSEGVNKTHTVKTGESLWSIGFDLTGSNAGAATVWPQIYELNQDSIGADPGLIHPGQELVLPQVKP